MDINTELLEKLARWVEEGDVGVVFCEDCKYSWRRPPATCDPCPKAWRMKWGMKEEYHDSWR